MSDEQRAPPAEPPVPAPQTADSPPETTAEPPRRRPLAGVGRSLRGLLLPALAVFTAFLVGAVVIIFSDQRVLGTWTTDPIRAIGLAWSSVINAYGALLRGAFGDPGQIIGAIAAFDGGQIRTSLRPLSETILSSTPLIFTGLAVALAFRAGLFNIGAEGQLQVGMLASVLVGFSLIGLPLFIHLPLALLAGALGGALWGFIPGILKARTGAHEVITTIMLNFIAYRLVDYALKSPLYQRPGRTDPISRVIEPSATLPPLVEGLRAHWGIVLAILAAVGVSWLLFRSTKGFEFRAVGLNPFAARYAGMSISRTVVLTMMTAGALAGLAGASIILGATRTLTPGMAVGTGFDGIAIALLGRAKPAGVVAAALLFGALRAGSTPMQAATGIPIHLVVVIQGLVIMFVAAPALVRAIYRIRAERVVGAEAFSKGWGG
jgi:general nucleoside transport system permease protein